MHFWAKYDHSTDALFRVQTVWNRPVCLCWVSGNE